MCFFLLSFIIVGLAACGNNRSYERLDTDISDTSLIYEYTTMHDGSVVYETDIIPAAIDIQPLTISDFIQDLDYLLYVLKNNYANFDVAYIERGVDITAIIHELQGLLLAEESITFSEFYYILMAAFRPLFGIAHFRILPPHPDTPHLIADISYEDSYQPTRTVKDYFDTFTTVHLTRLQQMFVDIAMYYGEEKAYEKWNAIQDGDTYTFVSAVMSYNNMPNIFTRIIEEEKVAYLAIRSMFPMQNATTPWHETTCFL